MKPVFQHFSRAVAGLSLRERGLLAMTGGLLLIVLLAPTVHQSQAYHAFADQRTLCGWPHAMDVLSNMPFALFGVWGLGRLATLPQGAGAELPRSTRWLSGLFFFGLLMTSLGSAAYHWAPDDAHLVLDRLGMCLPFAGLLGLLVQDRVSTRAAGLTAAGVLLAGLVSVAWSAVDGNVLPWYLLQAVGLLMLCTLGLCPTQGGSGLAFSALAVLGWYVAAKLFEAADGWVYHLSLQLVSGHSLKHLFAALAAWPVMVALQGAVKRSSAQGTIAAARPAGLRPEVGASASIA